MSTSRVTTALVIMSCIYVCYGESPLKDQIQKNETMLQNQRDTDSESRRLVLEKFDAFLEIINIRIKDEKIPPLAAPLKRSSIQNIDDTEHSHGIEKPDQRVCAYINASGVRIRKKASRSSKAIGSFKKGERVELLALSENKDTIEGYSSPWILVIKNNKTRGWVFGRYISKSPASGPGSMDRQDDQDIGTFSLPTSGTVTSRFGYRTDPVTSRKKCFHKGIDIAAPRGTPVYAAGGGMVFRAGYYNNGYGNLVVVKHEKDLCTYYGHLSSINVKKGQRVAKEALIGRVGSTGKTTGPHLHFEVRRGNTAVDPDAYLR